MTVLYSVSTGSTVLAADVNQFKSMLEGASGYTSTYLLVSTTGTNFIMRLGDAAGVNKFSIQDSASVEQFSVTSDGVMSVTSLTPTAFTFPTSATPSQTTDGQAVWDSDDDAITVGDGSSRKTFRPYDYYTAEGPMVPLGANPATVAALTADTNTVMHVGIVNVPHRITVTRVGIGVSAHTTTGTLGFALFSNDGQTRYFNETTASIAGVGAVTTVLTAPVTLEAGLYYTAINPDGTANMNVESWAAADSYVTGVAAATGLNEVSGTITVSASTIPTTFDPDAATHATSRAALMRFN